MSGQRLVISRLTFFLISIFSMPFGGTDAQPLHLVFNKLDQANGIPELNNIYYSQCSDGFTWVGSFEGLSRFDGKNVKVYVPYLKRGKEKIKEAGISSLVYEDKNRNKWFTTLGALHCISAKTDSIFSMPLAAKEGDSTAANHYAFHLDRKSNLWVIADGYLHKFNIETRKDSILHPLQAYVCYASENKEGEVTKLTIPLMGITPGIDILDYKPAGGLTRTTYFGTNDPNGLPPANTYFLLEENDTTIWIPSTTGLIRFNPRNPSGYQLFTHTDAKNKFSYCSAASWRDSMLWVSSTREGVLLFNKNSGEFVRHDTLFTVDNSVKIINRVNNLMVDSRENLWLSTWGKGIIFTSLKNQKFAHFLRPDGSSPLESHSVSQVAEEGQGRVWCALPEEGVKILDKQGKPLKSFPLSHFNGEQPFHVMCDSEGELWVLTYRSIFKGNFDNGFQLFSKCPSELQKIIQVSRDEFLVLNFSGLFVLNKRKKPSPRFWANPSIALRTPYQLFHDSRQRIFISDGTDRLNVYKWQDGKPDSLAEISGVGYINGMVEAAGANVLWCASSKGLLKITPAGNFKAEYIRDRKGLLDQTFNSVFVSTSGSVWLSSNNGVYKYDPETNTAKRYGESDGLQSAQFLAGSGCMLSDGRLCFGGINGFNVFDPDNVQDYLSEPVVHFTNIITNNKDTLKAGSLLYLNNWTFPHHQNTVQIDFTGIEYGAPEEVIFRYILKGYDIDTVDGGTHGSARFTRLPKGDYVLQVFAANSDGVWTSQPKEFNIRVLPHWTDTWWFKTILGIIILSIFYAYYRFRIGQIKKQEEMRRKEAEFRQKEAELKQQMAEFETAVLRLQMNPHFIFNSMNSINSYILHRDIETASDYLGRFANLMRKILKYAASKYISVSDEIDLLELYLNTEAMRFGQGVTHEFEVDESLDPDDVVLPTMILQPFVENAIWHGLANKAEGGKVVIRFEKQQNNLVCVVEDDGIGRQAAEALKDKSKKHESKALNITMQRLKLIELETGSPTHFEIEDLHGPDGNPCGTRVSLSIPFL